MFHFPPRRLAWLVTCCLLMCSVDAQIQLPCHAGYSGPDGGPCVQICAAGAMTLVGTKNLARACGVSGTTACATGAKNGWGLPNVNDNIIGALYHSSCGTKDWLRIDFGVARDIRRVKITYTDTRFLYRMPGAVVRVGDINGFDSNPVCATLVSAVVNDHECVATGRYMFLVTGMSGGDACIVLQEMEAYGACAACPTEQSTGFDSNGFPECQKIQQLCANPSVTSTGTQNFARMCGAGGGVGACTATMINRYPNNNNEQYGGPEVAVDGIKATFNVQVQGQFFHTTHISNSWWRVDFGVSRRIQRVQIQNRQDGGTLFRIFGAKIMIGDSTTVSENSQCGSDLSHNLYDHVVTCFLRSKRSYIS